MKKVIVITGVSSGIGEAFVRYKLKKDKDVFIYGLGRNDFEGSNEFGNYKFIRMDITVDAEIKNAIDKILKDHGHVDVLINNAGVGYKATVEDLDLQDLRSQYEVNVFGLISLIQKVLPSMRENNFGQIINISSIGGTISTPTLGAYASTKAALDKISEVLLHEIADYNISVKLLLPGAVKSRFGKNIRVTDKLQKSKYKTMYKDWGLRFRNFFEKRNTAEEAAVKIDKMLTGNQIYYFLTFRDYFIFTITKLLPVKVSHNILKKFFMKNESK